MLFSPQQGVKEQEEGHNTAPTLTSETDTKGGLLHKAKNLSILRRPPPNAYQLLCCGGASSFNGRWKGEKKVFSRMMMPRAPLASDEAHWSFQGPLGSSPPSPSLLSFPLRRRRRFFAAAAAAGAAADGTVPAARRLWKRRKGGGEADGDDEKAP